MRISRQSMFKPHARGPYKIENKISDKESTVYLYDEIDDWFGINAEEFVKDFDQIKSPTIHLRINSPGGIVFDGAAIFNAVRRHKSKVIVHIDGIAASIASVIAMAGNEIYMSDNAFLMIHKPISGMYGTAEEMRNHADLMDKVEDSTIAKTYTQKSGKTDAEVKKLMAAETWFSAQEALENGFIDEIEKDEDVSDKSDGIMFDLSIFDHVPDALKNQKINSNNIQNTQKEQKKDPSIRDFEKALIDAGASQKQAKSILADGYKDAQRDVESSEANQPAEPQRDAEEPAEAKVIQRDAEEPQPKEMDRVSELVVRMKRIAPPVSRENQQQESYQGYFPNL